jgi:hypothetical protein
MSHQPIPKFASEEEEAVWWDAHPEVLTDDSRPPDNRDRCVA